MDVYGIALSGMRAADAQLGVTADNIANADTPNFRAARVDLVSLSAGGVGVGGLTRADALASTDSSNDAPSTVDLAKESVNLVQAHVLYTANATVVRAANEMFGTLLDIMDDGSQNRQRAA